MLIKTFIRIMTIAILFTSSLYAGEIKGKITEKTSKEGLSDLTVELKEKGIKTKTNSSGEYSIPNIEEGEYTLKISGSGISVLEKKIKVGAGTYTHNFSVEYKSYQMQDLEVFSSSRRLQKITEAPSAISIITSDQLLKANSHGQIGKTMEHLPGVDVVQSGMNDFNINTRGFNNSINRRTLVLIDGRDPSTPMLNLVEWNSLQTNLADIKSIEVVRGPGSALYGMNAYNGVINITTHNPKDIQGTRASVTGGQYNTFRADVRNAGNFMDNFYYKVNAGYSTQDQAWVHSRDTANGGKLEYDGLRPDLVDTPFNNRQGFGPVTDIDTLINKHRNAFNKHASFRLDYELSEKELITSEFGISEYGNEYFVNQTGRILIPKIQSPYARVAYNSTNWNFNSHWRRRYAPTPQVVLNFPVSSGENSDAYLADLQWNDSFMDDKLKLIAGVSHEHQSIITAAGGSAPLLLPDSISHDFSSVYGQLEFEILKNLQFVFAGRIDRSTLFNTQFSPKAALVWTPIKDQTFRFTVNRSFLRPSYPEYTRYSLAAAPVNLANIDTLIANEFGIDPLGHGVIPVVNVGNPEIDVETAWSYEFGYKGVISDKAFITADFYLNQRSNFISNPLAALSPDVFVRTKGEVLYENDEANARLKEELDKIDPTLYSRLSLNPLNDKVEFTIAPANIGLVNEYGAEFGLNFYILDNLLLTGNVAFLDFEVIENNVPSNKILPNTSPIRGNIGAEFNDKISNMPFNLRINVRGVQGFQWIAGLFEGHVPEYWVTNLSGDIDITDKINFGFNIFNLFDRRHYQIFGGTILQRYATANISYTL